jgi:hypothetical protein
MLVDLLVNDDLLMGFMSRLLCCWPATIAAGWFQLCGDGGSRLLQQEPAVSDAPVGQGRTSISSQARIVAAWTSAAPILDDNLPNSVFSGLRMPGTSGMDRSTDPDLDETFIRRIVPVTSDLIGVRRDRGTAVASAASIAGEAVPDGRCRGRCR